MARCLQIVIASTMACVTLMTFAGCDSDLSSGFRVGNAPASQPGIQPPSGFREVVPTSNDTEIVEVHITNSNGSISTVKLRKRGPSYIGPRGEYYSELPTEAQLKPIYGF